MYNTHTLQVSVFPPCTLLALLDRTRQLLLKRLRLLWCKLVHVL